VVAVGVGLVFQKVLRGIVVHEKSLLSDVSVTELTGKVVTITYPADINGAGWVTK
jgi:hypothetical protein